MGRKNLKFLKIYNLLRSHIGSHFAFTPVFVRILPTDRCNLNCEYCWQRDNNSPDMTFDEFKDYLKKAKELNIGMITFLGGEPMIWDHIYDAIGECSKCHIITDLTTNGTLLNEKSIKSLGEAGLDYLNISVDGLGKSSTSKKNMIFEKDLIGPLKELKKKYRVHFRINSVIYKNNFEEIKQLIEFAGENNIQLSLGYIVPHIKEGERQKNEIYFFQEDEALLEEIVRHILTKKKEGYPIIDPAEYFENIFRFIKREKFWDCNYPTRYGWINVTPTGAIRSCTKKMDELDYKFLELNSDKLRELRVLLKEKVSECNIDCYSNCAYDSYFYTHHKFRMLKKILKRLWK